MRIDSPILLRTERLSSGKLSLADLMAMGAKHFSDRAVLGAASLPAHLRQRLRADKCLYRTGRRCVELEAARPS